MGGYTQWQVLPDGQGYMPVGPTVEQIEAGYYDLGADHDGHIYFLKVRAREDILLEFPDSASVEVIEGIKTFWERREVYRQFGITYKRGILMWGPPGSGKTSTLQIVARAMVALGGIVVAYNPGVFLNAYRALRDIHSDMPVLVLLEDFDEVLKSSQMQSQLLNLLDGVEKLDNVVFAATTNYPELLPPRIIDRPSRFDHVLQISHPDERARRLYLEALTGDTAVDVDRYVKDTDGFGLAHVKELFVATVVLGQRYEEALDRLQSMRIAQPTSKDDNRTPDEIKAILAGKAGYGTGGIV